jgi:hypothetical protein
MLCKLTVVLAIALALGSSALSTSAFARGGGGGGAVGGRASGGSDSGGCFGSHTTGGGCGVYGDRVDGFHGGSDHGYGRRDVWGHWGGYYGPMVGPLLQ